MFSLDDLLDLAERHARRVLIEHHREQLIPSFLYEADEHCAVIGVPWQNNEEKRYAAAAVRRVMQANGAKQYSFITEAWMAAMPKEISPEQAKTMRPSEQPNREEALIGFATDGVTTKWKAWSIKRDRRGRVTALPPKKDAGPMDDSNMSSWLTNLLSGSA